MKYGNKYQFEWMNEWMNDIILAVINESEKLTFTLKNNLHLYLLAIWCEKKEWDQMIVHMHPVTLRVCLHQHPGHFTCLTLPEWRPLAPTITSRICTASALSYLSYDLWCWLRWLLNSALNLVARNLVLAPNKKKKHVNTPSWRYNGNGAPSRRSGGATTAVYWQ